MSLSAQTKRIGKVDDNIAAEQSDNVPEESIVPREIR